MQKEIPILFKTGMVQALIAGTKTQTRRIVKGIPNDISREDLLIRLNGAGVNHKHTNCPYGKVGDLIWVKETWQVFGMDTSEWQLKIKYLADGSTRWVDIEDYDYIEKIEEQSVADLANHGIVPNINTDRYGKDYDPSKNRVRPSIFMPKDVARIWLQVTDIYVERLNDITEKDARKEGVNGFIPVPGDGEPETAVDAFKRIWQSINGPNSWDANPWVWVVSFKVLSTTGKPESVNNQIQK